MTKDHEPDVIKEISILFVGKYYYCDTNKINYQSRLVPSFESKAIN